MTLDDIRRQIEGQHLYVTCRKTGLKTDNLFCAYVCRKYERQICFIDLYDDDELARMQGAIGS